MRGNRYARGGDPMKTRSQRRKERLEKIGKTNRAQRLKKRMGRIVARRCLREQDDHMTAIMESYARRRKAEREAEKEAQRQQNEEKEEKSSTEVLPSERSSPSMKTSRPPTQPRRPSIFDGKNNNKRGRLTTRPQPKVVTRSLY